MNTIALDSARSAAHAARPARRFTPRLRLYTEPLLVERAGRRGDYGEQDVPVVKVSFDYGSEIVPLSDRSAHLYETDGSCVTLVERDHVAERDCLCLLESFGVVELDCIDDLGSLLDTEADYVVSVDSNVHALCSFSAYAIPQLRKLGWQVDVDESYPYHVVRGDTPWYANIQPQEVDTDWFNLELGVEVDGERIDMLPALLELLERAPQAADLDALMRVPARYRAVPVGGNRYVAMPPERLRIMLRVLGELHGLGSFEGGRVRFSATHSATVADLDSAFGDEQEPGSLHWYGATEVRERGEALGSRNRIEPARVAVGLQAVLRPYQQEGLNWLQHLRRHGAGGVLADDMGLGKTLQTIAHLATEKEARRLDHPSLIVMPTSLVGNWHRELRTFAPHLRTVVLHGKHRHERFALVDQRDVVLTTYPLLVRDLEFFQQKKFHFVILDEAQAIKNKSSLVNRAVGSLTCEHRLALTGTPVENNLEELWSLFDFLNPGLLGDQQMFRQRYRGPIEKDGNEAQLESLRQKVAPFILRRMKNLVARDLPPKTELVRPVELSGDQRDLYESIRVAAHAQVRKAIRNKGFAGSTIAILDALMKLRQACCDPRLVASESARGVRGSAKYDFLMRLLTQQLSEGRRVLLFSQFTQMLDLIGQGLSQRGIGYLSLTGASKERQSLVDDFEQRKADVFLISLKAGGTGLNLTSADTVIHYDPWWNPAAQAQATDRAYRLGQKKPVFVYNLIVAGSVEERMLQLQQRKQHLADTILGVSGTSSTGLSEQDVDGLLGPLDDSQV